MSNWYRFQCICPSCGKGDPGDWYHSEDSCCSTSGRLYINSECKIKCDDCYDRRNKTPSFILCWKFECIRHHGKYIKADEMAVCAAIAYICTNSNIQKSVRQQMINIVNNSDY